MKLTFTFYLALVFLVFCGCKSNKNNKYDTFTIAPKSILLSPKVESIFKSMTLDEKIGQLNLVRSGASVKTGEIVSSNIREKIASGSVGGMFGTQGVELLRQTQEMAVNSSRLGIPLIFGLDVIHGYKTTFPIPLALSCTWDMKLIEQVARNSANEATSDGLMWTFSPMVDIARDPRWGRIAEGGGEDPFLGSAIARAMVNGYQGSNLSNDNTMIACVKHFANYGASEGGRDYATVDMSKLRALNEYFPPYKAAIDAGVGSVMTSFNVLDYVPASANTYLYNDILRDQWKFNGLVVTDYTAINEMVNHGIGDLKEVSKRAINANVDMDMVGEGFLNTLKKSVDEGTVTIEQIDKACRRILKAKEMLGLFDDPYKYFNNNPKKELLSPKNRQLARASVAASMVLLKNDKSVLPLSKSTKIALVGPLADSRRNMIGCWSVAGDHDAPITVLEGFENQLSKGSFTYAKGCNITDNGKLAERINAFGKEVNIDSRTPKEMIAEAMENGANADVIVAVMGEAADMTGEASSMAHIGLQPSQIKLLKALKTLNKPIVLVLFNGRPMTLVWEAENLDAILDVWFGGTESGNAVVDVLIGNVNPSGKLTTSFPVSVGQIPVYHSMLNTGRPNDKSQKKFKSNYLDIPNEPLFPFGFGLSYTTFRYSDMQLSRPTLSSNQDLIVSVLVTNTGNQKGKEVVQMYIRDVIASISRPMKELKGFQKIEIEAKESKRIEFIIDEPLLKFYNSKLEYKSEVGKFEVMIGTNSVDVQTLKFKLK
ncbi:MAG: beta-glucosidase BglX [Saprospiraceae bacterium]